MAYMLESFIDVDLSPYNPRTDMSPIPARSAVITTMAGIYDADEDEDAAFALPHSVSYTALVLPDTLDEWREAIDELRALVGKRGRLYRRAENNQEIQWALCRLMAEPSVRETRDRRWLNVTFDFLQLSPWRGHYHVDWLLDDGEFLDEGLYLDDDATWTYTHPLTVELNNGGNGRVTDAILTITAGGVAITAANIAKAGETDIDYTGTVAAGDTLTIDTGSWSVLNDGVDAYNDLELGGDHAVGEWLRLDPGDNEIVITLTTSDLVVPPTVTINYRDVWK